MPYPSKTDRQTILAAAVTQVSKDGLNSLSIRGVAAALGVAPNALYRYFADRAALEAAVSDEITTRLCKLLEKAAARKAPDQAIRAIARTYLRFAREEPSLFAFTMMPTPEGCGSGVEHAALWQFVLGHVANLYGQHQAPLAAVTLWAFLHGMTVLEAAGVFREEKPAASFDFGLRMWLEAAKTEIAKH